MKKNHERIVKRNGKNQIGSERYAVMRKIPVEEKERILGRITKEAIENAHKMIAASGQNPEKYSPVLRECMAALIYGMLIAMSMENVGYYEWRWTEGRYSKFFLCNGKRRKCGIGHLSVPKFR